MVFETQGSEILFIVLWFVQFFLMLACSIVLILFRNKTQSIRARAPVLSVLSSIGAGIYLAAYTLSYSVPGTPCQMIVLLANVSFYVMFAPLLLRAWRIYFIYHWNFKLMKKQKEQDEASQQRKKERAASRKNKTNIVATTNVALDSNTTVVDESTNLSASATGTSSQAPISPRGSEKQFKSTTSTLQQQSTNRNWRNDISDLHTQNDQMSVIDVEDVPTLLDATEVSEMMRKRRAEQTSTVNKRRAEESNLVKFFVVMLVVVIVVMLPVSLTYPKLCPHDFLCQINERETNSPFMSYILYPRLVVPLLFLVDIMLLIEVVMLKDVNDSYSLNTEIRVTTVIVLIGSIAYATVSFTNLSFAFIVLTQIWVQAVHATCSYFPVLLLIYTSMKRNTDNSDELARMEVPNNIDKILENDVTRELFKRHLLNALCGETMLFYEEVVAYKKCTAMDRSQKAPNIIENYIKDDALNEINIAGKVKKRIIQRYNQITYEDEVPVDLFDVAVEKMKLVLHENGTYQSFLESQPFKNYVKKIKTGNKLKAIEVAGGI
ncbi:hypothetical protein C9374_009210 [Naegleria lovaniensis]|uniref:RGS domain-containing protein n=1 Tax=Naegleria lovaniensis TaxID=51637 RepID=A0AA88GE46_NAELO|nr:uncharacterized protein C9374_009210 [Naegleria lovaniensis]KAG2377694.1 hypothetical protein C9374_009210 [Naegleria lovaniensis]